MNPDLCADSIKLCPALGHYFYRPARIIFCLALFEPFRPGAQCPARVRSFRLCCFHAFFEPSRPGAQYNLLETSSECGQRHCYCQDQGLIMVIRRVGVGRNFHCGRALSSRARTRSGFADRPFSAAPGWAVPPGGRCGSSRLPRGFLIT